MRPARIPALIAALALLLALPARAAAGGTDDPLISRSYAEGVYRAEVTAALDAVAAPAPAGVANTAGLTVTEMHAGDTATLADGQQLILLSGDVGLTVASGSLINCTLGRGSTGGAARQCHRYVACLGARITATCASERAVLALSPAVRTEVTERPIQTDVPADGLPFADVLPGDWFYADVAGAWARGLVNGMDATHYAPGENITLAQAVKLAACMHQSDQSGAVTLQNAADGQPWYYTYVGYALEQGILDEMPLTGWDAPIDRSGFVRIFYRALPAERYTPINTIPDGAVPDVPTDSAIAREVYGFYAAGILTGYNAAPGRPAHAFGPDTAITRAEVAAIMNRMFDPAARVRFDMT